MFDCIFVSLRCCSVVPFACFGIGLINISTIVIPITQIELSHSCSQGQYSNGGVAKYYETTNQVIDLGTSVCTTCPVDYINTVEGAGFCTPCDKSNRQTTLGREGQSICVIEDPLTNTIVGIGQLGK